MVKSPRKRLGQHFLRDPGTLQAILSLSGPLEGEDVLEIGAGDGTLTRALLAAGACVTAVEIDRDLDPELRQIARTEPNLNVVEGDATKLDLAPLPPSMKMVSNLPYQAATVILTELCRWPERFPLMVVMVQREVGKRLAAAPGGKDYGSLTLWIGHRYETELCRVVRPGAFSPPPKVDSALVRLHARARPRVEVADEDAYFRLIRAAFAHRRKTLRNNLAALPAPANAGWAEILESAGVDGGRRAETLDAEAVARIFRAAAP